MPYIPRQARIGLGKESTRGTAVSPTYWLRHKGATIDDRTVFSERVSRQGRVEKRYGHDLVRHWAEGDVPGEITSESFGLLLLAALGSVSSAVKSGESVVYEHTFSLDQGNNHQSMTIAVDNPVGDKQFALAMLNFLQLDFRTGAIARFNSSWVSKAESAASLTPSDGTEYLFKPQDITFKHATDSSGLSGASDTNVKSMTVRVMKEAQPYYVLESNEPDKILNHAFRIELDIETLHDADTYRDYWTGETTRAIEITLENAAVTIGTASSPKLVLTLYEADLVEWRKDESGPIVRETMKWAADYSEDDGATIQAVLTNLVTSY